jgi:hypothetical protein
MLAIATAAILVPAAMSTDAVAGTWLRDPEIVVPSNP